MISPKEKAYLHMYPDLAGITEAERRQAMVNLTGAFSSLELNHEGVDLIMAHFEEILWDRVDSGQVKDPRCCRKCGRPLKRLKYGRGECVEGCELRKVHAWDQHYWRRKLPNQDMANTRHLWKVKSLWGLLTDFLDEHKRTDHYLAGIIHGASGRSPLLKDHKIEWETVNSRMAHLTIEAIKGRLKQYTGETA